MYYAIPDSNNLVKVEAELDAYTFLPKETIRSMIMELDGGRKSDVLIEFVVTEVYPIGTRPSLERLGRKVEEVDEGEATAKWAQDVTTLQVLENEERCKAFMAELVAKLLTLQSGCREYLLEKMVEEGKRLVMEAKEKGLEFLHAYIDVEIAYAEVDLDNLP